MRLPEVHVSESSRRNGRLILPKSHEVVILVSLENSIPYVGVQDGAAGQCDSKKWVGAEVAGSFNSGLFPVNRVS